jgi:energy-coupling factor transport system permease protein
MTSYLQRRNPTVKLLVLLVIFGSLTIVFDPFTPVVFFTLALMAAWILGGIRPTQTLRTLLPFIATVAGVFLANILFNRLNATTDALFYLGPLKVTRPALTTGASLSFRMLSFAAFSIAFVRTTDPTDLILSLIHQMRLHYRLAYGTMVGYRMLPLLQGEYEAIRAAHRVRGVQEREGKLAVFSRMKRYSIPLLAGAVRRASRVALAMDARGFGAFPERSYRRRMRVSGQDWLFLSATVALTAGLIVLLDVAGLARFGVGV